MDASHIIRAAVAEVESLRQAAARRPTLALAVASVKCFQSRRFEHSYADLLRGGPYQAAAKFFLDELYGDTDYTERDSQFGRIAGAIQRLLPKPAVATAVALAKLHALTETLDHAMALAWERNCDGSLDDKSCYVSAWRSSGCREDRHRQLQLVLEIGMDLDTLTRTPGLRLMLRMMRSPANAAGLPDLQRFLEVGFDTFATMGKRPDGARGFLTIVATRERKLIDTLFDEKYDNCLATLAEVHPAPNAVPRLPA